MNFKLASLYYPLWESPGTRIKASKHQVSNYPPRFDIRAVVQKLNFECLAHFKRTEKSSTGNQCNLSDVVNSKLLIPFYPVFIYRKAFSWKAWTVKSHLSQAGSILSEAGRNSSSLEFYYSFLYLSKDFCFQETSWRWNELSPHEEQSDDKSFLASFYCRLTPKYSFSF